MSTRCLLFWYDVDPSLVYNGFTSCRSQSDWCFSIVAHNILGNSSEWKNKATREIEELLSTYGPEAAANTSLTSHLASIPLEAWEAETPVLDALIHETLRIAQPHTAMRRNLGPDTVIDSKTIPSGAYIVYPFSDVHLNPELYPDPWKFDPSRKEAKTPFGYVGWGGGECAHHYVVCRGIDA